MCKLGQVKLSGEANLLRWINRLFKENDDELVIIWETTA